MRAPRATAELRALYEQRLSVRHVAIFELVRASPDDDALTVRDQMVKNDFHVMPVEDGGSIQHYVIREELTSGILRDHLHDLTIRDIVAESMPLLDAMSLFTDRTWFFVMAGNRIEGIVTLADMRRPPVQMFLFAMVVLLEGKLARLIRHFEGERWQTLLTAGRLAKASELLEDRRQRDVNLDLVDCLQMCDKRTIAEKSEEIRQALQMSKAEVHDFLRRAEELRNELAHAQDFLAHRPWSDALRLIEDIERALDAYDGTITIDFSGVPSELAIGLAQHARTRDLTDSLAATLGLDDVGRDLLYQELVGWIAQALDTYLHPGSE